MIDDYFPAGVTGAGVRALRVDMGMTQAEFGELLGVVKRTVSGWENGNPIPQLSESRLRQLAEVRVVHGAASEPAFDAEQLTGRVTDLEARVDYLERLVLKMRADELAQVEEDPKPPTEEDFRNSGGYGLAANRAPRERAFDDQSDPYAED